MGNTPTGLDEFLAHIQKRPFNGILIERFNLLVQELPLAEQRNAMDQLAHTLLQHNPHMALRSCYSYLLCLRNESAQPEYQIHALKLIQLCFRELNKHNHATLIEDDIHRLEQKIKAKKSVGELKKNRTALEQGQDSISQFLKTELLSQSSFLPPDAYEDIAQELFHKLKNRLGNFAQIRNQRLAVGRLIQAYDEFYRDSAITIKKALAKYGRNPLLWTSAGSLQTGMESYFANSRVFLMGKDPLTAIRMRMCLEMLTAYYDQRLLNADRDNYDEKARTELMEEWVIGFLDAGVRFPSLHPVLESV